MLLQVKSCRYWGYSILMQPLVSSVHYVIWIHNHIDSRYHTCNTLQHTATHCALQSGATLYACNFESYSQCVGLSEKIMCRLACLSLSVSLSVSVSVCLCLSLSLLLSPSLSVSLYLSLSLSVSVSLFLSLCLSLSLSVSLCLSLSLSVTLSLCLFLSLSVSVSVSVSVSLSRSGSSDLSTDLSLIFCSVTKNRAL